MRRFWPWILLVVLAGAAFWSTHYLLSSPRWALYQIGRAINNHDPRLFLSYVDVDAIVLSQKDAIVEMVVPRERNDDNTRNMVKGLVGAFMGPLTDQVRARVIKAVEDTERRDLPSSFTLAVAASVLVNGEYALVVLKEPEKKRRLRMGMRRTEDQWRVVDLDSRDLKRLAEDYLQQRFGRQAQNQTPPQPQAAPTQPAAPPR
ncbi:MAG: DUF2939 domain-containing protein [Thermodesulfobacteriota bacterium]